MTARKAYGHDPHDEAGASLKAEDVIDDFDEELAEEQLQAEISSFVVRCRYVANAGQPEGVGYLDAEGRCTNARHQAKEFDNEADAWAHANMSGEQVPDDCWAEPAAAQGIPNTIPMEVVTRETQPMFKKE